jgi:hypothetical protein
MNDWLDLKADNDYRIAKWREAMNAETLKDFLISLGFKVDEAGARKLMPSLPGRRLRRLSWASKLNWLRFVVAFTAKIASGLDNLYWALSALARRCRALSRLGMPSARWAAAWTPPAALSKILPGSCVTIPALRVSEPAGVQTRDASGNMRDMATIFTGVGQRLSSMPYYRANQYAQMLGLDENTLMAMRRGIGQFSGEYTAMAKAIGYNADVAAVSSNKFMTSLRLWADGRHGAG